MKKDGGRLRARSGTFLEPGTAGPPAEPAVSPPTGPAAGAASAALAGSAPPGTMAQPKSKARPRLRLCRLAARCGTATPPAEEPPCRGPGPGPSGRRRAGAGRHVGGARGGRARGRGAHEAAAALDLLLQVLLRWFTFRFGLPGLSRASLMLLDAESMKLSRSRVASRVPALGARQQQAARRPVSSSSKQQPLSRARAKARRGPEAGDEGAC